jgi:hypothetical protein
MADTKTLHEALLAVQSELKPLEKDGQANYGKYVTLGTLMETVLPLLNKHGLVLTQNVTTLDGHPALETVIFTPVEKVNSTMLLMCKSDDPQSQGSAITYARRYALSAMLGIVGDEDDDGEAGTQAARTGSTIRKASEKQLDFIKDLLKQKEVTKADDIRRLITLVTSAEPNSYADLTADQATALIEYLKKNTAADIRTDLLSAITEEASQ